MDLLNRINICGIKAVMIMAERHVEIFNRVGQIQGWLQ